MTYLAKGFNKIILNFDKIKTICLKYYSSFFSKSKLHNYIKYGYVRKNLLSFANQSSLSIFIIVLKMIYQSLELDFKFKI